MGLRCPQCKSPMHHQKIMAGDSELALPAVPTCEQCGGAYIAWGPNGDEFVPREKPEPGGRRNYGSPLFAIRRVRACDLNEG